MSAHVIGIVRSATRLCALTYVGGEEQPIRPWERTHACELRPLDERHPLWRPWRSLAAVRRWDTATRDAVLAILGGTVPCCDPVPELPPIAEPLAPPRATAAHPRGYRGTKRRPPKARQVGPIDLRPYLLSRRHIDQVLARLGARGGDPASGLDPWFAMHLWPLVRDAGGFAQLARALALPAHPALHAVLVGVYVTAGDPERAARWWSHVHAHRPEQRLEAAQLVAASGIARCAPIDAALALRFAELPAMQQWSIQRALATGAAPAYLVSGLALDALTDDKPEALPAGQRDVTALVEATAARFDDDRPHWRRQLWRLCGHQPELVEVVGSRAFAALAPAAAHWIVKLADSARWNIETADRTWRVLAPALPQLAELAVRLPSEYQGGFVEHMADVFWWASENDEDAAVALARCAELCVRVARPPFATTPRLGHVLPSLGHVSPSDARRALCDAPDASWLALEAACRRTNQARILWWGLHRMARVVPQLVAATFAPSPGPLLDTADLVAALSFEAAERVLRAYATSALAGPALADAPLEELCAAIEPVARAGGPNPVRRVVRRHLAGVCALTAAQLAGHRARIAADLDLVRLAAIRQAVERELAARIGAERIATPAQRHAAALLGSVEKQQRQLRRMLAATVAGDRTWRLRHPLTAAWLARHPTLRRDVWLAGFALSEGGVRLAIETDPLEALKLGTYVGSCLGRGGGLAYSAAAVVLDVNKQVVYARDAHGAVIGRQLVAIAESDELVCFHVYGAQAAALQPLFRRFDRELAERLGLPLFAAETGYEIATILSHEWWDDSAWIAA